MKLQYMPAFVTTDLIKVVIACVLLHYVRRMEAIKCLEHDSWKPSFIKFYCVLTLILVTISLFSTRVGLECECNFLCVITSVILGVILIYAVYTHVRELEDNFYRCQLDQQDENVHEFLKLYSLLMVICLIFVAVMIISGVVASTLPIPKYLSMQRQLDKSVSECNKYIKNNQRKNERRLVRKVANEVKRQQNTTPQHKDAIRARAAITGRSNSPTYHNKNKKQFSSKSKKNNKSKKTSKSKKDSK